MTENYTDFSSWLFIHDYMYRPKQKPARGHWVVVFRVESDNPARLRGKRFSSLSKARKFLKQIRFGALRRYRAGDWSATT